MIMIILGIMIAIVPTDKRYSIMQSIVGDLKCQISLAHNTGSK